MQALPHSVPFLSDLCTCQALTMRFPACHFLRLHRGVLKLT